jgi:hypothetical protein
MHLRDLEGWLDEDDPFFAVVDEIVEARFQHQPRVLSGDVEGYPESGGSVPTPL